MALKVGPNEAERFQVIAALRAGKDFAEATAPFRKDIEPDWFERNEEHLLEVAGLKPKRAMTPAEREAARLLLTEIDVETEKKRYPTIQHLAHAFPGVDLSTFEQPADEGGEDEGQEDAEGKGKGRGKRK